VRFIRQNFITQNVVADLGLQLTLLCKMSSKLDHYKKTAKQSLPLQKLPEELTNANCRNKNKTLKNNNINSGKKIK